MRELIKIQVEKSVHSVEQGSPVSSLLPHLRLPQEPIAAVVNGRPVDLSFPLERAGEVNLIYPGGEVSLEILRHSASHLLAQAVLELFPESKTGIGPAVDDGFYYDFLRETPFTPQDMEAIEVRMKELAAKDIPIQRIVMPKLEAIRLFQGQGQELKVELVREKAGEEVTCYRQGDFIDFCLGPHVPSTRHLLNVKLLSISGAYWKGDEKGRQLQRIYGTVFFQKKELEDYLTLLEEARKRDHRKLGVELDLFSFNEALGGGLVLWHPKGAAIRRQIENFWHEEHVKDGYEFAYTPHLAKLDVWRKSGHTEFYEAMYPPLQSEGIEYEIKPMNCPFHIMIYESKKRSYRDLPFRLAELGTVYRFERSGVLHGLLRVRGFTQDDAHIFCSGDELEDEIKKVVALALRLIQAFGFREYEVFLATRPEKYVGSPEDWDKATKALEEALKSSGIPYRIDQGEGVFYGPKIDIKIKDALKRLWQCTTVQLDFNQAERFHLGYDGEDGKTHRPFLIHRALLGSLERFFGILVEHYNGNFPVWLAPVQVRILPIAERHETYARTLNGSFLDKGLRSDVDLSREKVGHKIREAEIQKIPLILIVGDKEVQNGTASLRVHGQGDLGQISLPSFLEKVNDLIKNKSIVVNF